ncbi:MAG: dockerin type I repeat-containing protein [candidate division Zixibacteria bacterium]|nr:dockerin type I repeat-containing protein [candidate division Zixibacteria bacterium]
MYSDIENSWPGEGNICCNPQFCYPDTDNYYLGQNSCCIGAGCDSLGNPDSTIDLGAFGVGCQGYVYGDANGDGVIDLGDVVYLINYLYRDGDPPNPIEAGDANCDGTVDLGDAVYLLNYLFRGGPPPSC